MQENQLLDAESCLNEEQAGFPPGLEAALGEPLTEDEVADTLEFTDSTILPPEPPEVDAAETSTVRLAPPPITRVFQGIAVTKRTRRLSAIDTVVFHTPEGRPQATLDVLKGKRASFDFFLPLSGELYRCNDYRTYIAWQAGDWPYNERSVGIEQGDYAENSGQFPDDHYRRLAYLVAWLVQSTGTPLRYATKYGENGFIDHSTITPGRRVDPGKNFRRDFLMQLIRGYLDGTEPSPYQSPIHWERGALVAVEGAVARREYRRDNNIMRSLEAGKTYTTDGYTNQGQEIAGSARWYHLSESSGYGWVHSSGGTYTSG